MTKKIVTLTSDPRVDVRVMGILAEEWEGDTLSTRVHGDGSITLSRYQLRQAQSRMGPIRWDPPAWEPRPATDVNRICIGNVGAEMDVIPFCQITASGETDPDCLDLGIVLGRPAISLDTGAHKAVLSLRGYIDNETVLHGEIRGDGDTPTLEEVGRAVQRARAWLWVLGKDREIGIGGA